MKAIMEIWQDLDQTITLPVEGNSMLPIIRPGDRIDIRLMDVEFCARGDVIAFRDGGKTVVHRLLRKRRGTRPFLIFEKGDHLLTGNWIDGNCVIGRVDRIHRKNRVMSIRKPLYRYIITPVIIGMTMIRSRLLLWRKSLHNLIFRSTGTDRTTDE